jgi:hypothetical protein
MNEHKRYCAEDRSRLGAPPAERAQRGTMMRCDGEVQSVSGAKPNELLVLYVLRSMRFAIR